MPTVKIQHTVSRQARNHVSLAARKLEPCQLFNPKLVLRHLVVDLTNYPGSLAQAMLKLTKRVEKASAWLQALTITLPCAVPMSKYGQLFTKFSLTKLKQLKHLSLTISQHNANPMLASRFASAATQFLANLLVSCRSLPRLSQLTLTFPAKHVNKFKMVELLQMVRLLANYTQPGFNFQTMLVLTERELNRTASAMTAQLVIATDLPKLRKYCLNLDVVIVRPPEDLPNWWAVVEQFTELTMLKLTLRTAWYITAHEVAGQPFVRFMQQCKLQDLTINLLAYPVAACLLSRLAQQLAMQPSLTLLSLSFKLSYAVDFPALVELASSFKHLPNLVRLQLNLAENHQQPKLDRLQRLELFMAGVEAADFSATLKANTRANWFNGLTMLLHTISRLSQLEELDLNLAGCSWTVTNSLLANLALALSNLPHLTRVNLNFSACPQITNLGLDEFAQLIATGCSSLRGLKIDLAHCSAITQVGLDLFSQTIMTWEYKANQPLQLLINYC
jgi:hypothetical protein